MKERFSCSGCLAAMWKRTFSWTDSIPREFSLSPLSDIFTSQSLWRFCCSVWAKSHIWWLVSFWILRFFSIFVPGSFYLQVQIISICYQQCLMFPGQTRHEKPLVNGRTERINRQMNCPGALQCEAQDRMNLKSRIDPLYWISLEITASPPRKVLNELDLILNYHQLKLRRKRRRHQDESQATLLFLMYQRWNSLQQVASRRIISSLMNHSLKKHIILITSDLLPQMVMVNPLLQHIMTSLTRTVPESVFSGWTGRSGNTESTWSSVMEPSANQGKFVQSMSGSSFVTQSTEVTVSPRDSIKADEQIATLVSISATPTMPIEIRDTQRKGWVQHHHSIFQPS